MGQMRYLRRHRQALQEGEWWGGRGVRALSFLQPWLYCIFELGKDVENRKWACFDWMIGQPFLIHASAGFDQEGYEWLMDMGYNIPNPQEFAAGKPIPLSKSAIVGRAVVTGTTPYDESPSLFDDKANQWAFGPHVWSLQDVERFEEGAHHVKGALGFWQVDPYIVRKLYDQLTIPVAKKVASEGKE